MKDLPDLKHWTNCSVRRFRPTMLKYEPVLSRSCLRINKPAFPPVVSYISWELTTPVVRLITFRADNMSARQTVRIAFRIAVCGASGLLCSTMNRFSACLATPDTDCNVPCDPYQGSQRALRPLSVPCDPSACLAAPDSEHRIPNCSVRRLRPTMLKYEPALSVRPLTVKMMNLYSTYDDGPLT